VALLDLQGLDAELRDGGGDGDRSEIGGGGSQFSLLLCLTTCRQALRAGAVGDGAPAARIAQEHQGNLTGSGHRQAAWRTRPTAWPG
jgi:hypothetical protein